MHHSDLIFVCGNIIADYLTNVSVIISAIISVVLVILLSEILFFIVRILFGSAKHSRIYWLVAFAFVFLSNLIANQTNAIVITIIMSFLLTVAVNFFGKCIWAFIRTKKFHQIFGYVVGSISLIIIILFVIFWNYDHFGKSRIAFYMENTPEYHFDTVEGFDQYLENGSYDESVDLHAGDSKDVWIDCTDMSDWTVQPEYSGLVMQEENYVLDCTWDEEATPKMQIKMTPIDLIFQQYVVLFLNLTVNLMERSSLMMLLIERDYKSLGRKNL